MQAVSNEFKELAKSNARISLAKFVIKDSNTEIDGETIIDGFIEEMTCENTSLVGNVMAKNLETSIYNNFTNDFIGKEIYAYTGQRLENGTEEYVPRGTFIIDESEEDVSSGALKLKGLDYTIKFNKAWEDPLDWGNNTYTLGNFAKAVCEFCDLELETEEFSNSDYVLTQQPAFEGYQCRYVMQKIAEIATSNVFISPEDKVQIRLAPQNYISADGSSITLEESANSRLKIDEFDGEITQETTILPSEYTQVEYIESTGTQYIDTGIKADSTLKLDMDMQYSGRDIDYRNCFGAIVNGGFLRWHINPNGANNIMAQIGRNNPQNAVLSGYDYKTRFHSIIDVPNLKITTQVQETTKEVNLSSSYSSNFDTGINFWLFRRNADADNLKYYCRTKIYNFKMYQNNVLVRNFIPCYRNSDNVIGLYDYVNGIFYTNQGTDTFVKGANVTTPTSEYPTPSPDYPQDIEITTGRQSIDLVGKNLFDKDSVTLNKRFGTQIPCDIIDDNNYFLTDYIKVEPNTSYTGNSVFTALYNRISFYDNNKNWLSKNDGGNVNTITTPANCYYIRFGKHKTQIDTFMLVKGTTIPTVYKPYKSKEHEINLGVLGKNLFTSKVEQGAINANAGSTYANVKSSNATRIRITDLIRLDKTKSYTISCKTGYNVALQAFNDNQLLYIVDGTTNTWVSSKTFTNIPYIAVAIRKTDNSNITPSEINNAEVMLEVGTSASTYEAPNPLELGKIKDYKDFIRKGNGKNLYNSETDLQNKIIATNGAISDSTKYCVSDFIPCLPNTKYVISYNYVSSSNAEDLMRVAYYDENKEFISRPYSANKPWIITTPTNCYYLRLSYQTISHFNVQVEQNDEQTEYEPYGFKDKWYLHKGIKKIILDSTDGTASWNSWSMATASNVIRFTRQNWLSDINTTTGQVVCSHFKYDGTNYNINTIIRYNRGLTIALSSSNDLGISDVETFKTWLGTNKPIVYYVLATPIITEITNDNYPELYSQLKAIEKIRSFDGITYIDVDSVNLPFDLSLQYDQKVSEDIDINSIMSLEVEDTSYKPYNAVTLALADGIEGENVTLRDEESIALYGERALVITANEFAINQAVREELIKEMFNSINGFNYVPMKLEYNSYDWLERYDRIKVQYDDDKYYETYLFNHTTEFPSTIKSVIEDVAINETKVKYEFVPEEQQKTLHAEVVVDKLNGAVQALASESEDNFSSIRLDIDGIKSEVQSLNVENDELGNEINVLRSSITEQTSTAITDWFNTALKSTIENLENSAESNDQALNEIKSYVRRGVITDPTSPYYNQAFVELGDTTNQTTLRILPNRIQFLTNGQETAFISNNQLYINESTILTKEKIGNWVTTQDENGLLNTYWED